MSVKSQELKKSLKVGQRVEWQCRGRSIEGVVQVIFIKPTAKLIKSKRMKRNASLENPADLVKSDSGNLALKLETELHILKKTSADTQQPEMFR